MIECGAVCFVCIEEDKDQYVTCIGEANKLKKSSKCIIYILNLQVYLNLHFVLLVRKSVGWSL